MLLSKIQGMSTILKGEQNSDSVCGSVTRFSVKAFKPRSMMGYFGDTKDVTLILVGQSSCVNPVLEKLDNVDCTV